MLFPHDTEELGKMVDVSDFPTNLLQLILNDQQPEFETII